MAVVTNVHRAPEAPAAEAWMERALALAARAWGETHPNPMVGALIVEDGRVVAEGHHRRAGSAHAEIEALRALGRRPEPGATLVVTLEPCCTQGRTGPCTQAILDAGIRRVVVGATDPNPDHAGRGLDLLRHHGVEVTRGVLEARCADLNIVFNHWIRARSPLVAAKVALTLDGCLAAAGGRSRWVTGTQARADVMRWRRLFPAIAVGRSTVAADDPSLTARLEEGEWCPRRFVFDSRLSLARGDTLPKLLTDAHAARTVLVCGSADEAAAARVRSCGAEVWECPAADGRVDLRAWRTRIALEGVPGVLVEPGAELFRGLVSRGMPDYLLAYTAPRLLGDPRAVRPLTGLAPESPDAGLCLRDVRHAILGDDTLTRGHVVFPQPRHT